MTIQTTTPVPVTSAHIAGQLSALATALASLEQEAQELAYKAVGGDKDAANRLAQINAEIERANADRSVLERARSTALNIEAGARDAAQDAERKRHLVAAREHAARLIEIAGLVDQAIAALTDVLPALDDAEASIKRALGQARVPLQGASFGQSGIAMIAVDKLTAITDGRLRMRGPGRSISDTASRAWDWLKDEGQPDDN